MSKGAYARSIAAVPKRALPVQLAIGELITNEVILDAYRKQSAKRARRDKSKPEDDFAFACKAHGLPMPARQALFAKHATGRLWAADFCWQQYRLLVEIDGLVPHKLGVGRHQSIEGMSEDMVKLNTAALLGYAVLRFSQNHVKSGYAIETTMRLLAARGWKCGVP